MAQYAGSDVPARKDRDGDDIVQDRGPAAELENVLTIDTDIMVLANPETARLQCGW